MGFFEKIGLIIHILRWRLSWNKHDLDFLPTGPVSPKFITARAAAELIPDGAVCFSCGFAGTARCSVFFWAIRDRFQRQGHPGGLTWMNVGAQGGRGKVPGTVEELGLPGLMTSYITGHVETAKQQLRLAEAGQLEIHLLPQGIMTYLLESQAHGIREVRSAVALGTMLDPRVGSGSQVTPGSRRQFIRADGDALVFTMPSVEYVFINAPYADAEGNVYYHDAASINENEQAVAAVRANGGKVFVTVASIIPRAPDKISLPAEQVDYLVVHPYNEQTASVRQRRYWPIFTPGAQEDVARQAARLHYINTFLKITPVRTDADVALAKIAAGLIREVVPRGAMANIGVGFPEEVARQLMPGTGHELLFTTEDGAYGGVPVPGIFFGTALGPQKLISSFEMFRLYQEKLGLAVLGFVQVDEKGNVNLSRRGPKATELVGPGGAPDIIYGAKVIVFIGNWQANARFSLKDGNIIITKPGSPKFVQAVDEITFNAREALRLGKQVYYVTQVGIFRLVPDGLQLWIPAAGIDVQRDILKACPARIFVSRSRS